MTETIILIGANTSTCLLVQRLCSNMRIKLKCYEGSIGDSIIEQLMSGSCTGTGAVPDKSLMIFGSVSEKHFDKILFELRHSDCQVDYKAALTPTNAKWTLGRMYFEMEKEYLSLSAMNREKRND